MNPLYVRVSRWGQAHPAKPEWGTGRVLSMDLESTVVVFFMRGGHRMIDQHIAPLDDAPAPDEDTRRVLEVAAAVDWRWRNHNVYVVELDLDVFKERRFFEANL